MFKEAEPEVVAAAAIPAVSEPAADETAEKTGEAEAEPEVVEGIDFGKKKTKKSKVIIDEDKNIQIEVKFLRKKN